jgi:hypothetical protein
MPAWASCLARDCLCFGVEAVIDGTVAGFDGGSTTIIVNAVRGNPGDAGVPPIFTEPTSADDWPGRRTLLLYGSGGQARLVVDGAGQIVCSESYPPIRIDADEAIAIALTRRDQCVQAQRDHGFQSPRCRDVAGCGHPGQPGLPAALLIGLVGWSLLRGRARRA